MDLQALSRWRWPAAAALLLLTLFLIWPRGGDSERAAATPPPSIGMGQVGGAVATPTPTAKVTPTASPSATPTVEPTPTPATARAGGFEVLACRSISGSTCNKQLGTLPPSAGSFTALVRFTDARAGDQLNATLDGPSGTIAGLPYTLQGSGRGYYYSEFQAGDLPAGDYTLTATHNGEVVATTSFRKVGG